MTILPPSPEDVARAPRPVRAPVRPDDRSGVRGRNGELLTRQYRSDDLPTQFDIPAAYQEPGWSLQWVRVSCHGEPDGQNYNQHYANGWRPVPAGRVPDQFNMGVEGEHIVRSGLMLMERPETLTREATREAQHNAKKQKHNTTAEFAGVEKILDQTGSDHHGAFVPASPEVDSRGVAKSRVNRQIEGSPTSLYPSRQYAVGDEE